LRAEPAEETAILAYLQRGDAVTITGPPEATRGERFVPVEDDATGETGWVRELAIDPRSLVLRATTPAEGDGSDPEQPKRRQPRNESDAPADAETLPPVEVAPEPTGNCDPSYPGVCIPPPPPNLNCPDVGYEDFAVQGRDPHGFDGDNDGVGCES
jgi:hypothetical protein